MNQTLKERLNYSKTLHKEEKSARQAWFDLKVNFFEVSDLSQTIQNSAKSGGTAVSYRFFGFF